ncbi:MAG: serine/threonine-protein kinase [Deltaproteobacteria bacterium]|nr:serine/threonine-protein kinase [Deltaproteobacteria bacterium]
MRRTPIAELLGGKYEVLELAGEGGMAKVYRGQTLGAAGFTRPIAIKRVLAPLSQNPEFLKMFVEEARVVSELEHPNIAQIHDFDRDRAGEYYLVLEWVDGLTLAEWREAYRKNGRQTPWHLVAAIGIEVLKALHAAHVHVDRSGNPAPIFHRDVTPQNAMVSKCGVVKLTDFGLARAMDRSSITKPGFVKGKIAYLAPELTYEADPSAQTDLFSVGVVLWEVLAGEKLFKGKDPVKVVGFIRDMEIPSLAEMREDVPARLREIIERALQREPTDRYRTAHAMGRDLAALLRATQEPTDSDVIAKSVDWAQRQLNADNQTEGATKSFPPELALALAGAADETIRDTSIPLTRRTKRQ